MRYFVSLAEELHFGRAAAREHIVQSALSQQIQRLERELRVPLVDRSTHHVELTSAGAVLLTEARRILGQVDRAIDAVRTGGLHETVRVAAGGQGYALMSQIVVAIKKLHPNIRAIHQVDAGVPDQYRMLAAGTIDAGLGRAVHAPDLVASEIIRRDRLGVLVSADHRLARDDAVRVVDLDGEPMLFADEALAPEVNEVVRETCRSAGFIASVYPFSPPNVMCASMLVGQAEAIMVTPETNSWSTGGARWIPLTDPVTYFPRSLMWQANSESPIAQAIRECARTLARMPTPARQS